MSEEEEEEEETAKEKVAEAPETRMQTQPKNEANTKRPNIEASERRDENGRRTMRPVVMQHDSYCFVLRGCALST